jgi:uncharacterized protein (DUF433 family)
MKDAGKAVNVVQSINLIAINSNVRRGRPHIIGTSVTVLDVAIAHVYHAQNADGIAAWYALSLPQVYAALAYYYEHKDEIDAQIREQIQRAEAFEAGNVGNARSLLP